MQGGALKHPLLTLVMSTLGSSMGNGSIIWFRAAMAWMDGGEDDESMYIAISPCSLIDMSPPMTSLGWSDDESLAFGEGTDDEFLSLFFIVEFQKFFISLSVRPGKRAAIWDHLQTTQSKISYKCEKARCSNAWLTNFHAWKLGIQNKNRLGVSSTQSSYK